MKLGCMMAAAALAVSAFAEVNVWWVDDDNFGKTGLDGTSAETAFGTIQAALDNPLFAAGDTVKVLPGTYSSGTTSANGKNRVYISKSCSIISTGGKEVTFIVGKKPSGDNWYGDGAERCICSNVDGDVRIEGFTIMDGATSSNTGNSSYGGGISNNKANWKLVVADCTISGCSGYKGAAARYATLVRCLVKDNYCDPNGSVLNAVKVYSSIICGNTGGWALSTCDSIHSTIADNAYGIAGSGIYCNTLIQGTVGTEIYAGTYENSTSSKNDGLQQMVAPIFGDYRPVKDSPADGRGVGFEHSEKMPEIPESDRHLDFNKEPIPTVGSCTAGAIQRIVPVSGGIQIAGADVTIDGKLLRRGHCVFAESYPTQWCMVAQVPEGKYLYGYHRGNPEIDRYHANLEGVVHVMPPPQGISTNTVILADRAFWVDPNKDADGNPIGNDSNDGSKSAPFETLQKAVDSSGGSRYTVVFAAEGRYTKGGTSIHERQNNSSYLTNRVSIGNNSYYVCLRGAGAGKSFIVGKCDPDTGGNGPKAVRPAAVFCNYATIQGFTLVGGCSAASTAVENDRYGAIYGRTANGVQVCDCEITGCRSVGGIGSLFSLVRSRVYGNETDGNVLSDSKMISSAVYANKYAPLSGALKSVVLFNSTVCGAGGDTLLSGGGNAAYASILYNCGESLASSDTVHESLLWNVVDISNLAGSHIKANPCFRDPEIGDFRVPEFSRAIGMAAVPGANNYGTVYWQCALGDIFGNPTVFTGGSPMVGAVQSIYRDAGFYVNSEQGGLSSANGFYPLSGDGTLTVSAASGSRPCIGFVVGAVTNLFAESPCVTFTAADCSVATPIVPVYSNEWYVDAKNGTEDGWGFSTGTAKRTFAGLFATGFVLPGDIVHAAEGDYDEGEMFRPELVSGKRKYTVGSRLIVPDGVSVVADGRVEHTAIIGAAASNPDDYGVGSDALRCVSLGKNAKLKGFTLKGGRTDSNDSVGTSAAKEYPDNIGALAYGIGNDKDEARNQIVENCILTDGVARRGGGAAFVHLMRCKVHNTRGIDSEASGAASFNCWHTGTLITDLLSNHGVLYAQSFVNCTLCETNGVNVFWRPSNHALVRNSIIIASGGFSATDPVENCIFGRKPNGSLDIGAKEVLGETSKIVQFNELRLDGDWRPVIGESPAVDAGSNEAYFGMTSCETDLTSMQRIMNGAIDCGALEADWRGRFARDISRSRRFAVVLASPAVTETEAGIVRLAAGAELVSRWNGVDATSFEVSVKVLDGELSVSFGDETRILSAGEATLRFKNSPGEELLFAYSGSGYAEIAEISLLKGFVVGIR